jgi:PEP-CTERM motif
MKKIGPLLLAAGFVMLGGEAMADPTIPAGDEVQYTFTRLSPGNPVTFVYDSPTFIDVVQNGPGFVFTPTSCGGCSGSNNGTAVFAESDGSFDDVVAGGEGTLFLGNDTFTSLGEHASLAPGGATLDVVLVSTAVPEPSAWALMLAGLGGIGLVLRRAKRKLGVTFTQALAD